MRLPRLSLLLLCFVVLPLSGSAQVGTRLDAGGPAEASPTPPPPKDPEARRAWLKKHIDEILASPAIANAKVSMAVVDPENGRLLYGRNERVGLNAASNVKIVTEVAALSQLGPEFRWKTSVLGPSSVDGGKAIVNGELRGDLYVRTSGDPTLSTEDLQSLAATLSAIGVRKVRGSLVIDTSAFDPETIAPAFDQKNESAAFRAPSSAASLNANVVAITITPAALAGAPARVVLDPPSAALVLTGKVTTATKGPAPLRVDTSDAGHGQTRVTVAGRIRVGSEPRTILRRVATPETYFGQTFKQVLAKRGIVVEKPVRIESTPKEGLHVLATHESPPLAVVVQELGKRSVNFAAEQIVRTLGGEILGRPGTWQKGLDVIARFLDSLGIPRTAYVMKNGSGLYDSNRFSAEQIVTVLRAGIRDFRIASELLASFAVAGTDGTLAHRMTDSPAQRFVRAKTGTLATVSCLSGLVGAPLTKPLVFSILVNDVASPLAARAAQDRITELLVTYLDPSLAK
jgi:D-alanyl-D-alanine carboxypeptidase/D-alanyl-D-alanine-endopeptidase (penicillin-binding protein 4)